MRPATTTTDAELRNIVRALSAKSSLDDVENEYARLAAEVAAMLAKEDLSHDEDDKLGQLLDAVDALLEQFTDSELESVGIRRHELRAEAVGYGPLTYDKRRRKGPPPLSGGADVAGRIAWIAEQLDPDAMARAEEAYGAVGFTSASLWEWRQELESYLGGDYDYEINQLLARISELGG